MKPKYRYNHKTKEFERLYTWRSGAKLLSHVSRDGTPYYIDLSYDEMQDMQRLTAKRYTDYIPEMKKAGIIE